MNRTLIIDFDFPTSQNDDDIDADFQYYHKVEFGERLQKSRKLGASMSYYDSIIQKRVISPAMNYFGIDDVVLGSINSSVIVCWPVFVNNSYYGSVFGLNGPVQQIVTPTENDGLANIVVKDQFDKGVNLYSDYSVATGRTLYEEENLVLQMLEIQDFNNYEALGPFSSVNTLQSGL